MRPTRDGPQRLSTHNTGTGALSWGQGNVVYSWRATESRRCQLRRMSRSTRKGSAAAAVDASRGAPHKRFFGEREQAAIRSDEGILVGGVFCHAFIGSFRYGEQPRLVALIHKVFGQRPRDVWVHQQQCESQLGLVASGNQEMEA